MGRKRRRRDILCAIAAVVAVAVAAPAQQVEQATNPYQGEFEYRIGEDLNPRVSVDGVLIDLIRVTPRSGEAVADEQETEIEVAWALTNSGSSTFRVLLVLLLEDEQGNALERIELPSTRVARGRTKDDVQRVDVRGRAINQTRKIYLYCELE